MTNSAATKLRIDIFYEVNTDEFLLIPPLVIFTTVAAAERGNKMEEMPLIQLIRAINLTILVFFVY